jgi:uncharacterized protein (TIGR03435 family)
MNGLYLAMAIGILHAQTFEVASIRPSKAEDQTNRLGPGPQGGLRAENVTALQLIAFAYSVRPFQIAGGPGWIRTDRFNVTATPDKPEEQVSREILSSRVRQRVQALLMERFGLVLRSETREMPVYGLVLAKSGSKLTKSSGENTPNMSTSDREMKGTTANMKMVAYALAGVLHRPVIDETGLEGTYDFNMEWTPDEGAGPALFTVIQDRLGLKLESKKAPAPVFVIEKIDKPSEN